MPAQAQAAPQVPAVYLPPFYQAERSVAHALLAAAEGLFGYFSALNADLRVHRTGGLLSLIANSEIDGQPIRESYAYGW